MTDKKEKIFAEGFYVKRYFAPWGEEIIRVGINYDNFLNWCAKHVNENGNVNLDLRKSKNTGNYYAELNTFKPTSKPKQEEVSTDEDIVTIEEFDEDEIPF